MAWAIEVDQITDRNTLARKWRDGELESTDWIIPITDHPERAAYLTYRTSLRDWPADAENFPDTKPTL